MRDIRSSRACATRSPVPKRPGHRHDRDRLLSLLNRNSYEKGGFVLHMLQNADRRTAFFDALRAYYAEHQHSTAVTDDLRAAMEQKSSRRSAGSSTSG